MSEKSPKAETQMKHEAMYRKTIDGALDSMERGSFTEEMQPRIITQLRAELGQCAELLLISPQFYSEQMERLGNVATAGVEG